MADPCIPHSFKHPARKTSSSTHDARISRNLAPACKSRLARLPAPEEHHQFKKTSAARALFPKANGKFRARWGQLSLRIFRALGNSARVPFLSTAVIVIGARGTELFALISNRWMPSVYILLVSRATLNVTMIDRRFAKVARARCANYLSRERA